MTPRRQALLMVRDNLLNKTNAEGSVFAGLPIARALAASTRYAIIVRLADQEERADQSDMEVEVRWAPIQVVVIARSDEERDNILPQVEQILSEMADNEEIREEPLPAFDDVDVGDIPIFIATLSVQAEFSYSR